MFQKGLKMKNGTLIILNGTSSSGKTSIVQALQNRLETPYLEAGLDKFLWMLPKRYFERPLWDDVLGLATKAGKTGNTLVLGMHQAIEGLVRSGNSVIADHVLVEASWWQDCIERFSDLPAYLVGVRCDLDVLEEREKTRRDRTLGQARAQFALVHGFGIYDIEVDTARYTADECALQIIKRLSMKEPPFALREMKHRKLG
ncbi:MAG: hypothetical protein CL609_25040 [Anaerolineaceae bacterium]|nr:hypothetical protein [Anaerolineaceae bacterium]